MYNFYLFIFNYFLFFINYAAVCCMQGGGLDIRKAANNDVGGELSAERRRRPTCGQHVPVVNSTTAWRRRPSCGQHVPVVNTSTALAVTISFSLIQILQFDPAHQVITLVGWISLVRVSSSLFLSYMYSCQ